MSGLATPEPLSGGLLLWRVRRSLLEYVQRVGGEVSYDAPTTWAEDAFRFPSADWDAGQFVGDVRFAAYGRLLSIAVIDPWIETGHAAVWLSVANAEHTNRFRVVELDDAGDWRSGGTFSTRLTASGAELFGGTYPAGTDMAPIRVVADVAPESVRHG
ncbi:HtaA domain-containing protein [Microbacterium sp. NIBRBAC000506063]|uniref:HtaA domain-containing protein n=1 Tax=Microbacterium sp. NIBRBAC000506063 TaxID=2734618 RepID=UPI001BB57FC6|nr:HtaA domain-containing protein [Microbacterium sp. NIBRBAC000506063]QTV80485.1 HtaA domain-containing protein [Microbacterium sp. NIBRBAC000506063]